MERELVVHRSCSSRLRHEFIPLAFAAGKKLSTRGASEENLWEYSLDSPLFPPRALPASASCEVKKLFLQSRFMLIYMFPSQSASKRSSLKCFDCAGRVDLRRINMHDTLITREPAISELEQIEKKRKKKVSFGGLLFLAMQMSDPNLLFMLIRLAWDSLRASRCD